MPGKTFRPETHSSKRPSFKAKQGFVLQPGKYPIFRTQSWKQDNPESNETIGFLQYREIASKTMLQSCGTIVAFTIPSTIPEESLKRENELAEIDSQVSDSHVEQSSYAVRVGGPKGRVHAQSRPKTPRAQSRHGSGLS
jgi:hypothetical protein